MKALSIYNILREVIEKSAVNFNMLERELDKMFEKLDIDINFTRHFKERVLERGLTEEDILELAHKIVDKYGDKVADLPKDQNAVLIGLSFHSTFKFMSLNTKSIKPIPSIPYTPNIAV